AEIADRFVEVLVASSVSDGAAELLAAKSRLRVLVAPTPMPGLDFRRVEGGFLVQSPDVVTEAGRGVATTRAPTDEEREALRVAWVLAAHARSNAVVLSRRAQTVANVAGDTSLNGAAAR